jgi:hypothetical protein
VQHEVIMPALGMAQKTGLIVTWHKRPGEPVKSSDILLEVETDKATMDVEAGFDGFVATLMAEAGANVPVGSPIALISSERPSKATTGREVGIESPAAATSPQGSPFADNRTRLAEAPSFRSPPASLAIEDNGRILASPKAKRLAQERGIDLARLVAIGRSQPFVAADLDSIPPAGQPVARATAGYVAARSEIEARVNASALREMLSLMRSDADLEPSVLWAAFAASSLRSAVDKRDLTIRVENEGVCRDFQNPDLSRMSKLTKGQIGSVPDLIVRDFSAAWVISARFEEDGAPVLSLTQGSTEHSIEMRLTFDGASLSAGAATALVRGLARRVVDPIAQLFPET